MSQAEIAAAKRSERLIWLAGWALTAVILVASTGAAALNQDFSEPDNAMRLVRVRDMLAGQGWFDSVQHRLNPPLGTPMHWTQWIDAALAAPIALLTPLIGQHGAEIAVAFAWPLGLLAVFMLLVLKVCGELGERDGLKREAQVAGVAIAALAFPAVEKFAPGSFDHHNIELILALTSILGLLRMTKSPRMGALAGLALGAAMATAAEAIPQVAAGLVVAGALWLAKPEAYGRGLAWLGAGLAASSGLLFIALVPPAEWGRPVCDAMSMPFLAFGLAGGAVALVLGAALPPTFSSTLVRRFTSAAVLGIAAIAVLVLLFPECRGGGYSAIGADMQRLWMSQISESRSLFALVGDDPALMLAMGGAAFAGLIAAAFYLPRRWREAEGWIVLGFLLAAWVVLAWQIRGATFATAFAIPFGAWAVAKARQTYRAKATAIRLLAFAGIAASSAAAAWASAGQALQTSLTAGPAMANYESRVSRADDCQSPTAIAALNAVPTGVMLDHFTLGASVLLWTKHSVLAAPYHRDVTGTMTMINALRSSPAGARDIVLNSAADYVLVCPALSETAFYARHPADPATLPETTLSAKLAKGEYPDWLEPIELGGTPLKLYRVKR